MVSHVNIYHTKLNTIKTFRLGDERTKEQVIRQAQDHLSTLQRRLNMYLRDNVLLCTNGLIHIIDVDVSKFSMRLLQLHRHSKPPLYIPFMRPKKYTAFSYNADVVISYELSHDINLIKIMYPMVYDQYVKPLTRSTYTLTDDVYDIILMCACKPC